MRISDWSSDVRSSDLLLSKQPNGGWRMMDGGQGIPEFLATKGAGGWPDISIGGPGFCFPVVRWNGKEYAIHRHQYEGKACRPNREFAGRSWRPRRLPLGPRPCQPVPTSIPPLRGVSTAAVRAMPCVRDRRRWWKSFFHRWRCRRKAL